MIKLSAILLIISGVQLWSSPTEDIASPNQAVRDAAAKTLRETYVPPLRKKWEPLLNMLTPGMSKAAIEKVLSPYHVQDEGWVSRGGVGPAWYRLDEYWRLECEMDFVKDRLLQARQMKVVRNFQIEPTPKFTGVWITYYANGQASTQTGYKDGTIFGDYICYFSDGTKQEVRRYDLLGAQGESTDYYPSGKLGSRVYFKNSKPTGVWTWYNENGSISSTEDHTK